jgi:Zn-dependent peptidase ImmA (M78 family)
MAVRRKHIRTLAEKLLIQHCVYKPPVDVEQLAILLGIKVEYEPASDDLCGFLLRDVEQHKVLIGVNKNHSLNRKRFTIAHEVGHFFLHEQEKVHVDYRFRIKLSDEDSNKESREEEKEANLFAAELLMPVNFIKQDLADVEALDLVDDAILSDLANRYKVSTEAMAFRLAYLNYIQL